MKKLIIALVLVFAVLFSASAQGFYFDIGLGAGKGWSKVDGKSLSDMFAGTDISEIGVNLGLKAGYGPIAGLPIYMAAAVSGVGHRFSKGDDYLQLNSYLIGPSLILYPIPLLQLAGTVGFSYTGNLASGSILLPQSKGGFGYEVSLAFDFGRRNHGCLVGVNYYDSFNKLESEEKQKTSELGIFVKYAYRHKLSRY